MAKTDILAINPGSTTTKIAMFRNMEKMFEETITHDPDELKAMGGIFNQMDFRSELIKDVLADKEYDVADLAAVVGRGGMIIGLRGGGYRVTPKLCEAMRNPENPPHASSMGAQLAYDIAEPLGIPAFIYDSTMGCELSEVAKVSGLAGIERYGCFHVLNTRAQGMSYGDEIGEDYRKLNLIICHMGGGITVSAHHNGQIIDGCSYDDGPMSPERTGGIPLILWTKLCFSGEYTEEQVEKLIAGQGGLVSYLGVTDCRDVEAMIEEGNEEAAKIYEAMAYQVAKSIGQMSVALKGDVDAIILTGGIAYSKKFTGMITEYCKHLGKVVVKPGEKEMSALAAGADRILKGKEPSLTY